MIVFPYVITAAGFVHIERPHAHEIIERDVKPGDCFVVSPDGTLHHNHDEVCPFNGVSDSFDFIMYRD
jgi:hypothetical protein